MTFGTCSSRFSRAGPLQLGQLTPNWGGRMLTLLCHLCPPQEYGRTGYRALSGTHKLPRKGLRERLRSRHLPFLLPKAVWFFTPYSTGQPKRALLSRTQVSLSIKTAFSRLCIKSFKEDSVCNMSSAA